MRSVFLVSIVSSIVALALGIAAALGPKLSSQPPDEPSTLSDALVGTTVEADATVEAERSIGELAEQALTQARDVVKFARESAARDIAMMADMLRRDDADDSNLEDEGPENRRARYGYATAIGTAVATNDGSSEIAPGHPEDGAHPLLTAALVPSTVVAAATEPLPLPVFDGRDVGVTPPLVRHVRLRHASLPLSHVGSGQSGLVEVVFSASGAVESAKFITNPLNIHESMLLSAVKTWRFRPARRNGHAIRYRLQVPISQY